MNVRGNILIIWRGWKPNLQTSTFWHTISLSLPALPPLYPLVSSSHLTPFVSQGPIKSPLPPSSVHLSLPPSLSLFLPLSQMSPSFFCSYSLTGAPYRWFNFFDHSPSARLLTVLSLVSSRGWWGLGFFFVCVRVSKDIKNDTASLFSKGGVYFVLIPSTINK